MLIYTSTITNRLRYIAEFAGREITGKPFELTTDKEEFLREPDARLNYSPDRLTGNAPWIKPHPLLFESSISPQQVEVFESNGQKAFFATEGDFPFDIFAASFFLVSRYEEYLPHVKDDYGRYAHENSLAFRQGFLDLPLVNNWLQWFQGFLAERFPAITGHRSGFTFLPTYDIDIAWSYKHKGLWRNFGGLVASLLRGNWRQTQERWLVWTRHQKDPYDSYGWLNNLHEQYRLKPYYFFLLAAKRGRYDKNINPRRKALGDLVTDHFIRYPVGIHPSWQSGDRPGLLESEIRILQDMTGAKVQASRQHYIRFDLPDTFRRLITAGIRFDFSMGYGSINGFRASVATPFYWYDLDKDHATELMLVPFCFMEANSFYEQKFSAGQALAEMRHYYTETRKVNGTFVMIWHNHFFGTDRLFGGWREVYETFMKEVATVHSGAQDRFAW